MEISKMLGILKVLMWKHFVVRMRRYINTTFELISPIVLFIILFIFRNDLLPPDIDDQNIQQTYPVELSSVDNPTTIFYSPATDFTKLLMQNVENYLNLYPSKVSSLKLKPSFGSFENVTSTDKLSAENPSCAIILFKNVTETIPKHLQYSLRMNGDFKTYSYESHNSYGMEQMSNANYGSIYESFMKLQWAIDSSYIKLLTGKEIPQRVYLQEFPFKRSMRLAIITLICVALMFMCMSSMKVVFVMVMERQVQERVNGIQELIKMAGVSNNMLALSNVLNALPTGLVFSILPSVLLTVTSTPIFSNVNGFFIFVMLLLYFISVVSMAFVCSYIPNSTQYTTSIAIFSFILLCVPWRFEITTKNKPTWALCMVALLPHVPPYWFWIQVPVLEFSVGLNFSTITRWDISKALPVLYCYIALIAQSIIFFALSWYLSQVRPGPYGLALPWNFLCHRQYWSKDKVAPEQEEELEEYLDPRYYEPPHQEAEVGIKVLNVTKMFGKERVLNNVTLDVYKGEITVLLGHNGAGKTTLMSIITGMHSATEGNVYCYAFGMNEKVLMHTSASAVLAQDQASGVQIVSLASTTAVTWHIHLL